MFSFITMNWRGRPPPRTAPSSNSATTTETGLTIRAQRDMEWYAKGVKITDTDTEMAALPPTRHHWHGDWNYTLAATPND